MCREGSLARYIPASVCLLDVTEIGAFASPSECKSATIDDVNESLEVRGWLHRPTQGLLRTRLPWRWEEQGPSACACAAGCGGWASTTSVLLWQRLAQNKTTWWGGEREGRAKKD